MLEYSIAGDSHGRGLIGIIYNIPAHFTIDIDKMNKVLKKRQNFIGRGDRKKIESDEVIIFSGYINGKTTGAPLCLMIENKDYSNWKEKFEKMPIENVPRPGHIDYAAMRKYCEANARIVLEEGSARITAIYTAIGEICMQILNKLDIKIFSSVIGIGKKNIEKKDNNWYNNIEKVNFLESSLIYTYDEDFEKQGILEIERAIKEKVTLGGRIEIIVTGLIAGLGGSLKFTERLDAKIASILMGLNSVKACEIGAGIEFSYFDGNKQDELFLDEENNINHLSNNNGGITCGITNGENIIVRIATKPIPTQPVPLKSVDIKKRINTCTFKERGDILATPSIALISQRLVAIIILEEILKKIGGNSMEEVLERWESLKKERYF